MQIFALFMFLGMLTSLLVPEGKRKSLEELADEKKDIYQLQFQSEFYSNDRRGRGRIEMGEMEKGIGNAVSLGVGRGRGRGVGVDPHQKGRWWKLG